MTAMQELVVPRSIPRTFAIVGFRFSAAVLTFHLQGRCRMGAGRENYENRKKDPKKPLIDRSFQG
jgi:hypothetical protein